jgi:hypothetical protein
MNNPEGAANQVAFLHHRINRERCELRNLVLTSDDMSSIPRLKQRRVADMISVGKYNRRNRLWQFFANRLPPVQADQSAQYLP